MSDIRKWFMRAHGNTAKPAASGSESNPPPDKPVLEGEESSSRRKTSKYFAADRKKPKDENETEKFPGKRKQEKNNDESLKAPPLKKLNKVKDDGDDDFVLPTPNKNSVDVTPKKKLKTGSGRGILQKHMVGDSDEEEAKDTKSPLKSGGRGRGGRGASAAPAGGRGRGISQKHVDDESDEDEAKDTKSPLKSGGRGRGGRGASAAPAGGRGRGGGRGGFMNFGERKDPPHKGEKEIPEGAPDCLAGLTFVISGTLDSLEREEAMDLIKRHGGRVTGSVSKKTNYLLCDEDIEGRKSAKAKELGTAFLTEDGLFDKIRASNHNRAPAREDSKKTSNKVVSSLSERSPQKAELKKDSTIKPASTNAPSKVLTSSASSAKRKDITKEKSSITWTQKYSPKTPDDIIGNQSLVKQLHQWLADWNEQFLGTGKHKGGKKQNDSGAKKAVLLSGTPGIGKTTSAKLISQMLGFQAVEVNASDTRGKADSKIERGIGGSNSNSIKELVNNEALSANMDRSKHPKTVLIMDEVDGMSAGDRGGVADLIASIKISKIPIICICNDRYSQKLKSLLNYCVLLSFRKPTKQQMAKRLMQIAKAEGLQVNEIALEELAERVNGDIRMAINHLQYMSLSMSIINYDDIRHRLHSSSKDEDISPFTAVDKLFGFNGGKLRMDERIDLSMSDPDLVPLLIQENYINYKPSLAGRDDVKRMDLIARSAESIGDGDIINVQIRRYRQWQLSQTGCLASCIIPAALLHGQRETLEPGERNFNRFGGWLGKNSTRGKNMRLLEDLHVHLLASRESNSGRDNLRVEYLSLLLKQLTDPLRVLPKGEAVKKVVEFMNFYSISQEDFDTIAELSKFKGRPNPLDGIEPSVKAALTKAYKDGSKTRMVRAADLITLPGMKKAPKKRIAAMLEPNIEGVEEENGDALAESEDESSEKEDMGESATGVKLQSDLESLKSKGIQVQVNLKETGKSNAKKTPSGRGKGGSGTAEKKGVQASGRGKGAPATKRKR